MIILLICVAYIIIGSIFSAILSFMDNNSAEKMGTECIIFTSIFWPLSLPIILIGFVCLFLHNMTYSFLNKRINCENRC